MVKLDYKARRADGTTISQLRSFIVAEQATIDDLQSRIAACRENQNDYISRLSQAERDQLVLDTPQFFPNGLPSVNEVPYTGNTLPEPPK